MSRQIGLDTVFLRPTPRIAHTEYSLNYHTSLFKDSVRQLHDAWELDLLWCTNDGPIEWSQAGRCTDMGHAEYASGGEDRRAASLCPFSRPEEVYEFDPLQEYGLPSHRELVRFYEERYRRLSDSNPNQLITGGYYKTVDFRGHPGLRVGHAAPGRRRRGSLRPGP